jgi:hypothetical protein
LSKFVHLTFISGYTDFNIRVNLDRVVNVIDPQQANRTIATAPAKYVEMTFSDSYGMTRYVEDDFLLLGNDSNTAYVIQPRPLESVELGLPPEYKQILDSFELISSDTAFRIASFQIK